MLDKEFLQELEAVARRDEENTDHPVIPILEDGRYEPLNREAMLDLPCFLDKFSKKQRELLLDRN